MKPTKEQCPECRDFSTVRYPDGSYECFACRRITYPAGFEEKLDYESWHLQDTTPIQDDFSANFATGS